MPPKERTPEGVRLEITDSGQRHQSWRGLFSHGIFCCLGVVDEREAEVPPSHRERREEHKALFVVRLVIDVEHKTRSCCDGHSAAEQQREDVKVHLSS